MVIGDRKIKKEIKNGNIIIAPYDENRLGGNSYDVRLSKHLATYQDDVLDAQVMPSVRHFDIPAGGYMLVPGELYLGTIQEYIESPKYLPWIDGKSSTGRLGIHIHVTAGRGDVGFQGYFTLEIEVVRPVIVYEGMPIGQITFMKTTKVDNKYNKKTTAKYNNKDPRPIPSRMWQNFVTE